MNVQDHVVAGGKAMEGFMQAIADYRRAVSLGKPTEPVRQLAHDHLDAFLDNVAMVVEGG